MTLGKTGLGTTAYAVAANRPGVGGDLCLDINEINEESGAPQADEWVVSGIGFGLAYHDSGDNRYDDIILNLHRRRDPTFFIHKAVYPLMAAVLMSTAAVVLPAADLSDRIGLVFTLFLTVIAIQWVTLDRLPRTPFLTKLDQINNSAILMYVFLAIVSIGLYVGVRLEVADKTIEFLEVVIGGTFLCMVAVWSVFIKWKIHKHTTRQISNNTVAPDDAVLTANSGIILYEGTAFYSAVDGHGKLGLPIQAMTGKTGDPNYGARAQETSTSKQAW
jgi:hypothetical protein